jgi:hypothetical protein
MATDQRRDVSLVRAGLLQHVHLVSLHGQAAYSSLVCFFDLVVGKARLRYRSLLFTTNFKVALQVESTYLVVAHEVLDSNSAFLDAPAPHKLERRSQFHGQVQSEVR